MVRVGNFSVSVVNRPASPDNYVVLKHGETYKLCIESHYDKARECDAQVFLDGKEVGTWRLGGRSGRQLVIERPENEKKLFTFYLSDDSKEAKMAGIQKHKSENGLIKVVCVAATVPVPESVTLAYVNNGRPLRSLATSASSIVQHRDDSDDSGEEEMGFIYDSPCGPPHMKIPECCFNGSGATVRNLVEGATGLSGTSNQKFITVADITPDESTRTTIHLRLVGASKPPDPVPLRDLGKANAVPCPVSC